MTAKALRSLIVLISGFLFVLHSTLIPPTTHTFLQRVVCRRIGFSHLHPAGSQSSCFVKADCLASRAYSTCSSALRMAATNLLSFTARPIYLSCRQSVVFPNFMEGQSGFRFGLNSYPSMEESWEMPCSRTIFRPVTLGLATGIYLHATGKLRSWIFATLGLSACPP